MGLSVSHDCWCGAYTAFMRWRSEVAKCIGIPLRLMEGFYSWTEISWEDVTRLTPPTNQDGSFPEWAWDLHRAVVGAVLPLKWESFKPSPLHILLNHSDCEGSIPWESCRDISDALEKVVPLLPKGSGGGHIGDWTTTTQKFVDGLRLAHKKRQDVKFY